MRQALLIIGLLVAPPVVVDAFDATDPGSVATKDGEIVHLHKDNFDAVLANNEEVLVHFHAPWSKRCEIVRPNLVSIHRSADWSGRFLAAESDISDSRGYTSYLEHHGVTRLPAIVLFRNGHPNLYPPSEGISAPDIEAWLYRTTQVEAPPRGAPDEAFQVKVLVRALSLALPRSVVRCPPCLGARAQ